MSQLTTQVTVREIIEKVDTVRPNVLPTRLKRSWLAQLDGTLRATIIDTHKADEEMLLGMGADKGKGEDTTLLVPCPFDEIYTYWLISQIEFTLGEITRYNNSLTLYNMAVLGFASAYKARHQPIPRGQFKI